MVDPTDVPDVSLEETGPVESLPTGGAGQHRLLLRSPAWPSPGHTQVVGRRRGGEQEAGARPGQEEAERRRGRRDQGVEVVVVVVLEAGVEEGRHEGLVEHRAAGAQVQPGEVGRGRDTTGTAGGLQVEEPGGQQQGGLGQEICI